MTGLTIRDAAAEDAAAACDVLCRSISELCVPDHARDPGLLAAWLANKTPEHVAGWIAAPGGAVLVAEEGGRVVAVGSVSRSGRIGLNYVAPEARFRGVSKAMLRALEARAAAFGAARATLESTATALRFYRAAGYLPDGEPRRFAGLPSFPLARSLDGPQ